MKTLLIVSLTIAASIAGKWFLHPFRKSINLINIFSYELLSATCPPIYEEGQPNHFSAFRYAEHRDMCTLKCNEDDFCCTKDSGGSSNRLPCTIGCHIAWFSQDLDECKARCNWERPNNQDCNWEWHLQEVWVKGVFSKPSGNPIVTPKENIASSQNLKSQTQKIGKGATILFPEDL